MDTGHSYRGLGIHAAPGVHEYAAVLCQRLLTNGGRILEVGSGSGALALRLQDVGFDVTATDLEPNQEWIQPFDLDHPEGAPAGPFDLVVCVETLEHLENPRGALRSLRALLEPGAQILVSTPNLTHPHSRLKMLLTGAPFTFGPEHYYDTGHISMLPDWMLVEHLRQTGFDQIAAYRAGDFDYTGLRRMIHQAEMLWLSLVGVRQKPSRGDGNCLFVTASAV